MEEASRVERISLRVRSLEAHQIRETAERGMRMPGAVALWFKEGAWPAPKALRHPAVRDASAGACETGLPREKGGAFC